jgi:potassium channel subfamily K, other eukaryote
VQSWSYGTGLYFGYIVRPSFNHAPTLFWLNYHVLQFFLTIGYGDYSPSSPAGRVVFIVYALLAVPVMASFAVQAITETIKSISSWQLERQRTRAQVNKDVQKAVISHAQLVEHAREQWLDRDRSASRPLHSSSLSGSSRSSKLDVMNEKPQRDATAALDDAGRVGQADGAAARSSTPESDSDQDKAHNVAEESEQLTREVLLRAIELEACARRLLIRALPDGGQPQLLLRADHAVQAHDVKVLIASGADEDKAKSGGDGHSRDDDVEFFEELGIVDEVAPLKPWDDDEALQEIDNYRASFAALLFAGGRLRKLEGMQQALLERRPYSLAARKGEDNGQRQSSEIPEHT